MIVKVTSKRQSVLNINWEIWRYTTICEMSYSKDLDWWRFKSFNGKHIIVTNDKCQSLTQHDLAAYVQSLFDETVAPF